MFSSKGNGFHIHFPNHLIVSVQWGPGNYCDNYNADVTRHPPPYLTSGTAEVAVFRRLKHETTLWITGWPHGPRNCNQDVVVGYLSPLQVLDVLSWAAAQPIQEVYHEAVETGEATRGPVQLP